MTKKEMLQNLKDIESFWRCIREIDDVYLIRMLDFRGPKKTDILRMIMKLEDVIHQLESEVN